jgi:hypothetical protein
MANEIEVFGAKLPTVNVSASTSTGNVRIVADGAFPSVGVTARLHNAGTALTFIEFGVGSGTVATTTASIPLPAGATEVIRVPYGATYMAAITASGTATIYATVGTGA